MKSAAILLLTTAVAWAQYSLDWSSLATGGGTSHGGSYSVSGTLAPSEAHAPATSGNFSLDGGYWTFPDTGAPPPGLALLLSEGFTFLQWAEPVFPVVLEYSDDLTLWTPVDPQPAFPFWEEPQLERRFFRLRRTP